MKALNSMDKFLSVYQGKEIEDWGCTVSLEFTEFCKNLKKVLSKELKKIDETMQIVKFSIGHYDCSGFIEKNGNYIYFSYNYNRGFPLNLYATGASTGMLIRKAKTTDDYHGGANHFTSLYESAQNINLLFKNNWVI